MIQIAIKVLNLTHIGFLIFVLFGWLVPYREVWLVHMVFIPMMILQWKLNHNECLLTNLEHYLARKLPSKKTNKTHDKNEEKFVRGLIIKIFGRAPSDNFVEVMIRVIAWTCCLLSFSRWYGWLNL